MRCIPWVSFTRSQSDPSLSVFLSILGVATWAGQKNSKLATAPAKRNRWFFFYLSISPFHLPAGHNPVDFFLPTYCIFTYHNLISLFWIWSTYLLLYQWLLPPFFSIFSRAYQVGGKPIHRRRWYWNCKYFSSPLVIATVSVVYTIQYRDVFHEFRVYIELEN